MIMITKPYDDADATADDKTRQNDNYIAAGAGPLVLAPWPTLFGLGYLAQSS